jgi:hypothetical protein
MLALFSTCRYDDCDELWGTPSDPTDCATHPAANDKRLALDLVARSLRGLMLFNANTMRRISTNQRRRSQDQIEHSLVPGPRETEEEPLLIFDNVREPIAPPAWVAQQSGGGHIAAAPPAPLSLSVMLLTALMRLLPGGGHGSHGGRGGEGIRFRCVLASNLPLPASASAGTGLVFGALCVGPLPESDCVLLIRTQVGTLIST